MSPLAFLIAGLIVLSIGANPLERSASCSTARSELLGGDRLHALLRHQTSSLPAWRRARLPCRAVQYRWRRSAYIGGLGVGLVLLAFDATVAAMAADCPARDRGGGGLRRRLGRAAGVPAGLIAASHIVITQRSCSTSYASALMVYLLVNVLIAPGSMTPETREFAAAGHLPFIHDLRRLCGHHDGPARRPHGYPARDCGLRIRLVLLWHTPWGFELRAVGHNAQAATYAGHQSAPRHAHSDVSICGALAGFIGVNEIAWRPPSPDPELHRRLWLRRPSRSQPDGPQHPVGASSRASCSAPSIGRRGAFLRDFRRSRREPSW